MELIVWTVGEWQPSKINESMCKTVTLKPLDSNKTYKLYLDNMFKGYERWLPHLEPGNVIGGCQTLSKYPNLIDSKSNIYPIRKVNIRS